jgi:hypothetical protein
MNHGRKKIKKKLKMKIKISDVLRSVRKPMPPPQKIFNSKKREKLNRLKDKEAKDSIRDYS